MRARRPLARWVLVILFSVCAAAVPLGHRLLRPRAEPPGTLAELAALLGRSEPPLHAVPMAEHDPEAGVYLCQRPRPREQLQWLRRAAGHGGRWRGVVYCEWKRRQGEVGEDELARWGAYGLRLGPFVFFGDPDLLDRIRRAILQE